MSKSVHRIFATSVAFAAALLIPAHGQVTAPAPPPVAFRSPNPDINSPQAPQIQAGGAATVGESATEMGNLSQQKETLDSELRYATDKLNAAQSQLNTASNSGNIEKADKLQEEVNDWNARVKTLQSQQSTVDSEVQNALQSMAPPEPTDDVVLPGDNLEIFVVEDNSFNGRYQVRRGGYIILPAVGRIMVAGKTMQGAELEVRHALESSQLQRATVMIEKVEGADVQSGPVIFLAGQFRHPAPFHIPTGTKPTVVNVLLSCGGYTDDADLSRVKVMRVVANKSVVEEVNVQKILEGSGLTSDLTLSDGDVIMIPSGAANLVFVTGRVLRPGTQTLHPGDKLTAYSAILDAGGFSRFADQKKVYVLRASPDGTKVRIPVNVVAIQHGRVPDLPLEGSDILVVPEKFFSF